MIYIDNAATSFPKPCCVIRAANECIKKYCANPGRSGHDLSIKAAEEIFRTREAIAAHLSWPKPETVVLTPNATFGLNLAIKTLINENCHVLCTDFEHNSVIRPLERLSRDGVCEYSCFNSENDIEEEIRKNLRSNTRAIVCSIESNVTGRRIDLRRLSSIAAEKDLRLIIDASQAMGHTEIDLSAHPCDAFCAPGHKGLFGLQGSGFVVFRNRYRSNGLIEGGSGSSIEKEMPHELPEGYEAGTQNTPAAVSMRRGIEFIEKVGIAKIDAHITSLASLCSEELSDIPGIRIYSQGSGIFSFNYKDIPSERIANMLNEKKIYLRAGLHCAPTVHRKLGTLRQGILRASFSYMNSKSDVKVFIKAVKNIIETI